MTLVAFLDSLDARDIRLALAGNGRLRVDAPAGALTPGDRAALTNYKPALLAHLASHRFDPFPAEPGYRVEYVTADVYLCLELGQFDNPKWLADRIGMPLDEIMARLEASPHAAKGRTLRERRLFFSDD
jgi:hypothetical protein